MGWDWDDLVRASLARPGMWVSRPYADGLLTLWLGFSLGAQDGNFDRFASWLQSERFPATGGYKSPLTAQALVRRAVTDDAAGPLSNEDDSRAVALLVELFGEYERRATGR